MDGPKSFLKKYLIWGLVIFTIPALSQESPFILQEGVLIDPAGQNVFIMKPEGGVEGRNMADGAVVFETNLAAKPVGFINGQVYALTEGLERGDSAELMAFGLADQGNADTYRLPLGKERWIGINHGMGEKLNVYVGNDANRPVIWWESSVKIPTGANISAPPESFEGASLVIDPQTGNLREEAVPPAPEYRLTAAPAGLQIDQEVGQQFLSNDRRHVLVSKRINDHARLDRYSWKIYDSNGALVGSHKDRFSVASFHVSGSTLVYISRPFTLRIEGKMTQFEQVVKAINLTDSSLLWESKLREISYKGPLPP